MSDAVIISLIGAIGSFAAAALGLLNNALGRRNTEHLQEAKHAIVTLEENTNSIKDALVKVTGEAEHAKGVLEGKKSSERSLPPQISRQEET